MLNAQFGNPYWLKTGDPQFDSLCEFILREAIDLERQGTRVAFATNAACGGTQRIVRGQYSSSKVSSLLGHAHAIAAAPLHEMLASVLQTTMTPPSSIRMFSLFETPEQERQIERLRRRGIDVQVIRTGGRANG
jgi:hypothetical protein